MPALNFLLLVGGYFALLVGIGWLVGRGGGNAAFFQGERRSPWPLVAYGMIGASLSGVTFLSVPGDVGTAGFTYFQICLGYIVGYVTIAFVLLPLYYRLNLVSIYGYLEQRFGIWAYKTGAVCFLVSRTIGAAFRLFLVALVFDQVAKLGGWSLPFWAFGLVTIALIWIYTFKGGIKTVVWTDTLQTTFMLLAVGLTIGAILGDMNWSLGKAEGLMESAGLTKMFVGDGAAPNAFWKHFLSGAFITLVMTGLDQDMMQKNLTVKTLKGAQTNMMVFAGVLLIVNLAFLFLGGLLHLYAAEKGVAIPERSDALYPMLALNGDLLGGGMIPYIFLIGVIAAAYSSADSALTALTTSFCVDFLGAANRGEAFPRALRYRVHVGFSLLLLVVMIVFHALADRSVIDALFRAASYTYGPLLGLFAFGLITKKKPVDSWAIPAVCLAAPLVCYLLNSYSNELLGGYNFGYELLVLNGLLVFVGLALLPKSSQFPQRNPE